MAFCQECGSEVAPNDTFCPFCGISLTAANQFAGQTAAPSVDSSVEHQIVTPPSPFAESEPVDDFKTENIPATNAPPKADDNFETNQTPSAPVALSSGTFGESQVGTSPADLPKPFDAGKSETENPLTLPDDRQNSEQISAEISAPPGEPLDYPNQPKEKFKFDDIEKIDDKIADFHDQIENPPPISVSEPKHDALSGEKSEELPIEQPASSERIDFDEPSPVRTFAPANDPPNLSDDSNEATDFDATIAYLPPDSLKDFQVEDSSSKSAAEIAADSESDADQETTPETTSETIAPEISNDETATETPIFKPAEALDLSDGNPPPSQFDSVRIFENNKFDNAAMSSPTSAPNETVESSDNIKSGSTSQTPPEHSVEKNNFVEPPSAQIGETSAIAESSNAAPPATNQNGTNDSGGKKAAKLKPLDEGTVLNSRYEIIRKIGGGGMGAVYLATDTNLGGVLRAVKEMVQSYIEENQQEKAINDFKRESMILSTLDHPAIPTIYDYFYDEVESRFYLVMKYINGGDLSVKLRSTPAGKIDEKSVTEWGIQIADVLNYLHNRPTPVIYRDLKPANVMIDDNSGRVMLIDFGIARSVNKEEKGVTAVGTMGYAPPELFSGNVEPRSDIYSLGSTMFHLLTGADPQSNPLLIFDFQKNPRPRQINSQLSDQIERILMRAVEYNAEARFENAGEMRRCLQEHLENLQRNNVTYGVKEAPQAVSLEDQPVFCGFCGQRIMATDMFCAFCGAKQPLSQKGVHSEIYARPITSAKVTVQGTNDLDSATYDLDKDQNLIGRRDPLSNIFPELDLSKYDPQTKVSRRHALIRVNAGSYTVEDLGSSNGTTVIAGGNSLRLLPHQPQMLNHGDKIRVGDTMLSFSAS